METNFPLETTQDERIMAALTHASIILPVWGLVGTIVIWATQREKSKFVSFQALQAMTYQLTLIVFGMFGFACYACSFMGTFALSSIGMVAATMGGDASGFASILTTILTTFFPLCITGMIVLIGMVFIVYSLYGAARVLQGQDFRYAVVGRWLEKYTGQG